MFKMISELLQLWVFESIIIRIVHYFFSQSIPIYKKNDSKDKLVICGSGWSINDISPEQLDLINSQYDVMSFNEFYKFKRLRIDYHIIRELDLKSYPGISSRFHSIFNFSFLRKMSGEIRENSMMKNTIFFVLRDWKSGSALLWDVYFKPRSKAYFSNTFIRARDPLPSSDISTISHCNSTLFDCINIGYLLGYKEIILAGVDLNDRRYFYLSYNETREFDINKGAHFTDLHATASETLKNIVTWQKFLSNAGISLSILNKNSLLAAVLPNKIL